MNNRSVCVVIVTYNRKKLLLELLHALVKQTYAISAILIVDNNSSDGTSDYLIENCIIHSFQTNRVVSQKWENTDILYFQSSENTGGSGGFSKAFELVSSMQYDCVWAMDDDVNPEENCLNNMMKYLDQEARICIPCRGDENYVDYAIKGYDLKTLHYFHFQDCKRERIDSNNIEQPFIEVQDMAFEGPLVTMDLIKEIGIPDKDYFILFDDTDYARRATKTTKIRYITNAKLHKQVFPQKVENDAWTWKAYYKLRNSIYLEKKYAENLRVKYIRGFLRFADLFLRAVYRKRFLRAKWIARAYVDGCKGHMGKTYSPEKIVMD